MKAAALLAACLAAAAPAVAQDTLHPLTLRQDLLGWEGVGRIDLGPGGYCTAVLIAPDLVLTAAHCLFEGDSLRPRESLVFRAGHRNGESIATRRIAQAAIAPGYHPAGRDAAIRIAADFTLLRLDDPIPSGHARPFRIDSAPSEGSVSIVSYGAGRDAVLSRQARCNVLGRQVEIVAIDCDVTFGSSGAPVFRIDGTRIRIVSIISSGRNEDGGTLAFGPVLDGRIEALSAALRGGGGVWDSRPPEARRLRAGAERAAGGARFLRP